ncbi:MAG: ferrochelatase [Deltaproteobacteria bacterium RIFCSPLOWO2_12_FULL_40_28]|nr:MAG: ferrochelatase [Deltaproteobacteria bacterium RIFCSPHIGHO2_02_FULL_40_28]OGQ19712.1 MAG: ferrochelatase [Deltaproteobacteria bacterium RIFCSPHIGHO2_12_FULL_40_32]OGQ40989.1 MAG: ferrochelatase [Deltaproteobacteria bacterium RIFCSPLOWO2_02_FULL_40_36]OGQ54104.1 MAG: ferrochelatase [Deltaproteobacteria bacterium RIFCSPLOWO2_12_FULL_40_28]
MIGVLLINLGTPDKPDKNAVGHYLKEFLTDPFVIQIPSFFRYLLVRGLIVPFRKKKSVLAYQKIWTSRGSPLLVHTQDLASRLGEELGKDFIVKFGMRYGSFSIPEALHSFPQEIKKLIVVPLYPQHAVSSTQTAINEVLKWLKSHLVQWEIKWMKPFYEHPLFLESFAQVVNLPLKEFAPEVVLMSFHGLPVSHIRKEIPENNYADHCYKTSRALASRLNISSYEVSFQSRLGIKWLRPRTDEIIFKFLNENKRRLAVICPSFVCDCLETLEEIGIRLKAQFLCEGGKDFLLLPCLNASPVWVKNLALMIKELV